MKAAIRDDRNALLIGLPGSGKTTMLRRIITDSQGFRFALVDASLADSAYALIRLISRALDSPMEDRELDDNPIDLLDALDALPRSEPVVIVIDGVLDHDVAYTVFGRLRDQLWTLPYTWILATRPTDAAPLRTPPADAFWSVVLELSELDESQVDELLSRGLDASELERVREGASGQWPVRATPRQAVRWATDVLDGRGPNIDQELITRADRLGSQATMALHELLALDRPVPAGDPELLDRLGWTRPNASRWLARMESAGILRSFIGTANGQGRPPKLYEPARNKRCSTSSRATASSPRLTATRSS